MGAQLEYQRWEQVLPGDRMAAQTGSMSGQAGVSWEASDSMALDAFGGHRRDDDLSRGAHIFGVNATWRPKIGGGLEQDVEMRASPGSQ